MHKLIDVINSSTDTKLDIGCGNNKLDGYVGIDILDYTAVDIVDDYTNVFIHKFIFY